LGEQFFNKNMGPGSITNGEQLENGQNTTIEKNGKHGKLQKPLKHEKMETLGNVEKWKH